MEVKRRRSPERQQAMDDLRQKVKVLRDANLSFAEIGKQLKFSKQRACKLYNEASGGE